jgi:DNA-binding response OmpR family regulator
MGVSAEWSARTRRQDERFPMRGTACVIEPDDEARDHIAVQLRAAGFIAHETACGKLGVFIASQVRLHLVVVSLSLPDVSGLMLIRRLRREDQHLIIIALAPEPMRALPATLARFAGADAVLAAPASSESICIAINEAERAPHIMAAPPPEAASHLNRV